LLDLNKFVEWAKEKDTRRVSIEIGEHVYNPANPNHRWGIKIWYMIQIFAKDNTS